MKEKIFVQASYIVVLLLLVLTLLNLNKANEPFQNIEEARNNVGAAVSFANKLSCESYRYDEGTWVEVQDISEEEKSPIRTEGNIHGKNSILLSECVSEFEKKDTYCKLEDKGQVVSTRIVKCLHGCKVNAQGAAYCS